MGCHEDAALTMDKNGKTVNISVKKNVLIKSIHKKNDCVDCHEGFNPDDIPHKAKIEPVNCLKCHSGSPSKHVFHPQMIKAGGQTGSIDVNCKGCHGTHNVDSPKTPGTKFNYLNQTNTCGNCHKSEKAMHMSSQHYFQLSKNNPNVPSCLYCHRNPVTEGHKMDPAKLKQNQVALCSGCHVKNPSYTTQYSKTLVDYNSSVHGLAIKKGKKEAADCIDCHGSHDLRKADDPESRINQFNIPNLCGKCHIGIAQEYRSSTHGIALAKGVKDSPGCTYCHGEHNIKSVPDMPQKVFEENHINRMTAIKNKMVFCIGCHTDEALMKKYNISTVSKAHDWLPNKATHWETVRCVDCHSSYVPPNLSHNIMPPEKTIKKCEECHQQNSLLMTKLYKHEKKRSREKFGFVNGTLLSDAYVVGTTRNVFLESLSVIIFGLTIFGLGMHGFLRWYFRKVGGKK